MNYIKIYNNLIFKAQNRILSKDIYVERHHILPKCLVKDIEVNKLVWFRTLEDKDKLVKLLPEEHFIAHKLLYKIYPKNEKLFLAYYFMCGNKKYGGVLNNKEYAKLRIIYGIFQSNRMMGKNNSMFNHDYSTETTNKMSEKSKDRAWVNNGKIQKRIKINKLENFLNKNTDYVRGMLPITLEHLNNIRKSPPVGYCKSVLKGKSLLEVYGEEKSKEWKNNLRIACKKRDKSTYSYIRNKNNKGANNSNAKHFIFYSPCGIRHDVIGGFEKFCREQNLPTAANFVNTNISYKGWKIYKEGK